MRTVGAIGAWGLLAATPCAAEVVAAEPGGFALEAARDVAATPAAVWATLLAPARWWDGAHTYSGAATNLSLRAEPGGCFCERLPAGGAVEHDFLTLDEAGAFEGVGRVELIEGEIFQMSPLHLPHASVLAELTVAIGIALREQSDTMRVLTPVSLRANDHSLPEADLLVVELDGTEGDLATPEMVRLVLEVSASSLRHDLGRKLQLYARTGVPEYWVADVADVAARRLLRFHAPAGEDYTERAEFAFGDTIASATIDGLAVDAGRLA